MSGEYVVFGKILYDSGDFRYDCEDETETLQIGLKELSNMENDLKNNMIKSFPMLKRVFEARSFKIITFANYS